MLHQVFFCVGAAKTGTTILARMLDQQPDVACMWEARFVKPDQNLSVLNPDGDGIRRHGLTPDQSSAWRRDAMTMVEFNGKEVRSVKHPEHLRRIVTSVLSTFGTLTSSSVVGDKWPGYHRHIGLMLKAFPKARFVYNVRDPRAVWNSGQTFRDRSRGDDVLDEMLSADDNVRAHLDDERFMTLRYEDLVVSPVERMRAVSEFIGFDFDVASLQYDPDTDPFPKRWNWVPTASGDLDPGLTEKWRTEMPLDKQAEVTERCADYIERYGYSTVLDT